MTQPNITSSIEAQKLLINNHPSLLCIYLKSSGIDRSIRDFINFLVFNWFNALVKQRWEPVLYTFKTELKLICKTATALTWAKNCVNKGYLFPGKHLKTMQCRGMVLAEWDPSCAFRNLFYFDVIFLNE